MGLKRKKQMAEAAVAPSATEIATPSTSSSSSPASHTPKSSPGSYSAPTGTVVTRATVGKARMTLTIHRRSLFTNCDVSLDDASEYAYTDVDEELNTAFIDYFAQLVFPGRPLALASKHNRFINHPISTFLINRNIDTIVVILLEQCSLVVAEDVLDAHSIDGCLERIIRSQYRRHTDTHGYGNASQLLTRLRRLVAPKLLLSAIGKYEFTEAMHFAYVMRRHLIPIVQLNHSLDCLVKVIQMLWTTLTDVMATTSAPVWDTKTDRPLIYSHMPQLHNIEWMALAIDSLLVYFLRLLHMETEDKELRNQRRHLIFTTCTTFLVHPFGTYIERYPQTLIDFVNHRQSILSNVANHLLSLMHLLVPNMTDVLPEIVDETTNTFIVHKLFPCKQPMLTYDDLLVGPKLVNHRASAALLALAHCSFVMHMSTNIYAKVPSPIRHKLLHEDRRMLLYMPHVVRCLETSVDTLILKSCQLIYVLIVHIPPCSWSSEHFEYTQYAWIPRSLHVLGRAVLQAHDMNLLKVIVPQLHDILTRLTYDGMAQAVHVLMAFQSCHATHFRTDTYLSCAFEHICKRITGGLAPCARSLTYCLIDCDPPLKAKQEKKLELNYLARCLCKTIKQMCTVPDVFDANLLFHSKEQHKSVLQLLADLHNEMHGVGHLISLECAGACDMYIERLLAVIDEAETTVTEYLAARDTFSADKQLFCDHVVKRVHQLAGVKTFCLLVRKMRQLGHELRGP